MSRQNLTYSSMCYPVQMLTLILSKAVVHSPGSVEVRRIPKISDITTPADSSSHSSATVAAEIDFESSPPAAAKRGKSKTWNKLLMELRSPMMHSVVQKAIRSENTVVSLDQLYAQAVLLDPIFRVRIQRLAGMSCGYFPVAATNSAGPTELRLWSELEQNTTLRSRVRWPEIKHVDAAIRKMAIHYCGSAARLVDIVRQRIVFDSLSDICKCLEIIANDPDLQIVRFKTRFDPRTDALRTAGYRDVVVVLRVVTHRTTSMGVAGHRCE